MNWESNSTGSKVREKQRERWEIIYIYFTLSVHFYDKDL